MIETVVSAFVIARLKGYKLLHILKEWSIYPVLICAVTYIIFEWMIWQGDYRCVEYANIFKGIYLGTFIILAFHYNQTSKLVGGLILVWLGYLLNYIAIQANNGFMPVFVSNSWATGYVKPDTFSRALEHGDFHVLGDMYTKMIPLCDVWDLGWCVLSVGDILVRFFVFIVLYCSIKQSNKNKETNIK